MKCNGRIVKMDSVQSDAIVPRTSPSRRCCKGLKMQEKRFDTVIEKGQKLRRGELINKKCRQTDDHDMR